VTGTATANASTERLIEEALDAALPPEDVWPASIHRAMRYSLMGGGKRLRPLLVIESGRAVGGSDAELLPFACAVEMIHTYSLIHDDLPAMDDDDLRRGRPASHRAFGEATAILAGDALLTRAFELLARAGEAAGPEQAARWWRATALLAEAGGTSGLIGGQVEDLDSEGIAVTPEVLERIHRAKTGALLGAAVRGGAVLSGASGSALEALDRYARAIGLAFQIVDDLLDATQPSAKLGKTPGKDAAAGKATWVSLYGIVVARRRAQGLLQEALAALEPLGGRGQVLGAIARRIVERDR
jgi:geranylgeranyl pyrophosphate synthase